MLVREKVKRENPLRINLYKEGMFWKAYNYSAFNFSRLVRVYALKKKYVKELKEWIVTVGFPDTVLKSCLQKLSPLTERVNITDNLVEIDLKEGEELEELRKMPEKKWCEQEYQEWFDAAAEEIAEKRETVVTSPVVSEWNEEEAVNVLKDLRDFPILQKSPLEVQLFMIELQNRLKR